MRENELKMRLVMIHITKMREDEWTNIENWTKTKIMGRPTLFLKTSLRHNNIIFFNYTDQIIVASVRVNVWLMVDTSTNTHGF